MATPDQTQASRPRPARLRDEWPLAVAFLLVTAVVTRMVWPVRVGLVGFDSAASVIHFDRIVAGLKLENFVTTTPKPLLTLVYGVTHAIVPDWRVISLEAIAALGVAVVLTAWLLDRLVPNVPRAVAPLIAGLALAGSTMLVEDVGIAYAVVWALLGWLVAALAATSRPLRPWLVGAGLILATLVRLETVVITGVLALGLIASIALSRAGRPWATWTPRRLAVALAVAAAALPIMLLHDWLLTGDPLFWMRVSAYYSSASTSVPSPGSIVSAVVQIVLGRPLVSVAALVGLAYLWRAGHRDVLAGFLAMGPGLLALLVVLAARRTYVSPRYLAGIDIAIVLAGAIGAAVAAAAVARWVARRRRGDTRSARLMPAAVAAVAAVVILFVGQFAPTSPGVRGYLNSARLYAYAGDRSLATVRRLLPVDHPLGGTPAPAAWRQLVLVPALLRPRMAVDLNLPLWGIGGLSPAAVAADGSGVWPGLVIVHAHRFDQPVGEYGVLETGATTTIGSAQVVPAATLPDHVWVFRVQ